MTPAKLQELARQAGAIRLIDAADPKRKTPWSLTDAALAGFAGLVRAAALEEAARVCDEIKDQKNELGRRTNNHYGPAIASGAMLAAEAIRALAQQAGGEQASQGTIPADRRHDAEQG